MFKVITFIATAAILATSAQDCQSPLAIDPKQCCAVEKFFDTSIFGECQANIDMPLDLADILQDTACINVCILYKHNLLTAEEEIDISAVKRFIEPYYPQGSDGIGMMLQSCFDTMNRTNACSAANTFMDCVTPEVARMCPESMWDKGDTCLEVKTYLKRCKSNEMSNK